MTDVATFPDPPPLSSARLLLEPLHVEHADELAEVLSDPALHTFIGGEPASRDQLRELYERQVIGRSPDGSQRWLNWIVRRLDDGQAVGTVQATVGADSGHLTAEVAWVVGTGFQKNGYAREAAQAMGTWLGQQGVATVIAHINPEHGASKAVAQAIGLEPTGTVVDGEVRWQRQDLTD